MRKALFPVFSIYTYMQKREKVLTSNTTFVFLTFVLLIDSEVEQKNSGVGPLAPFGAWGRTLPLSINDIVLFFYFEFDILSCFPFLQHHLIIRIIHNFLRDIYGLFYVLICLIHFKHFAGILERMWVLLLVSIDELWSATVWIVRHNLFWASRGTRSRTLRLDTLGSVSLLQYSYLSSSASMLWSRNRCILSILLCLFWLKHYKIGLPHDTLLV